MYHCAPEGIMTPYHVTHGMTGVILVLPRQGLTDGKGNPLTYDRAYYIGENDFYVPRDATGKFKQYSFSGEDLNDWVASMHSLIPSHIVVYLFLSGTYKSLSFPKGAELYLINYTDPSEVSSSSSYTAYQRESNCERLISYSIKLLV